MLISTKGRYAMRILVDLSEHLSDGYIPLKVLSDRQEISEKYLESIVKDLVKAGLLKALRGKGGGYRLAVEPERITAGAVLRLTEDTLAPVACLAGDAGVCPRAAQCRTLPLWQGLDRVINDYLESVTVADLQLRDGGWSNYVI